MLQLIFVKFSFSEKAIKIWRNFFLSFDVTLLLSNIKTIRGRLRHICYGLFKINEFCSQRKFQISSYHLKSDSLKNIPNLQFHSALTTNVSVT